MARSSRPGSAVRRRREPASSGERGFTYLAILIGLALLGVALAAIGTLWSTTAQRDRETELLFVGEAYRTAIASYYRHGPGAQLPLELSDLIEDRRTAVPMRHLRRLYADPMTGRADWTLVRTAEGAIVGVRSASQRAPLKRANFPAYESDFADSECYCDWQFVYNTTRRRAANSAQ